jgi:glycosyltransferase involved in cell wall biosynthesis
MPQERSEVEPSLRLALLPWMVAGVKTQYENLRLVETPPDCHIDTIPIVPYQSGGIIERLPLLRSSQKGTIRSMQSSLALLSRPPYDAVLTQAALPLLPLIMAYVGQRKMQPAMVYTIDTTPRLMDGFHDIYYGTPPAGITKRALRDALHRFVLNRCMAIVPWSRWAASSFQRDYGVPSDRIHVIPPGVDLDSWSISGDRQNCFDHPFKLLFVGADFERKGGPLLLDVFRRSLSDEAELHIVTKAEIQESPRIHVYRSFEANESGLRQLYAQSDALVLPTQADCFSLASLEAMACGLPVISCPVGGIPEIIRHGETGLLIAPNDGRALLSSIRELMEDRQRAVSMGRMGRQVVEEQFDNKVNARALFDVWRCAAREHARELSMVSRRPTES